MKRIILPIFIIFITCLSATAQQYSVSGGEGTPYKADISSNVLSVYLLNGLNNATITYTSSESGTHQWYKYNTDSSSIVAITCTQTGNTSVISDIEDGWGYYVGSTTSPSTRYVWIIDYSKYLPTFNSLHVEEEDDLCQFIKLVGNINAPTLKYYSLPNEEHDLHRTYHVSYESLVWDEDDLSFYDETIDLKVNSPYEIIVDAPLKDTEFTLTGDEYAQHFGLGSTIKSDLYEAVAIEVHDDVIPSREEYGENELKTESSNILGGSAPIGYTFNAYANEPVASSYTWRVVKMGATSSDSTTIARFQDKSFTYNFIEEGNYRIILEVLGRHSICFDNSISHTVMIGETHLDVPNFFSPGSSIGVNDEFRVSYRSLMSFHCQIFNRQGNLLYEWTNPAEGWNGMVKGRYVPTGVYFYVIKYTTSQGKKETKSGSVNILRKKE